MTVTASDVDEVVALAIATLRKADPAAWDRMAGTMTWTCWETVEHLADDLFAYAAQLGPKSPPSKHWVPFQMSKRREGGPENSVHAEPGDGPEGLLEVLDACGAFLVAMVRTADPALRAHHGFGLSDPNGFAAMGVVETLVHMHDLAEGLELVWEPPTDLCARTVARLFPDAPTDTDPWATLLWATGRGDLPGRERLTSWRWDSTVRD